jgi:regulator of nucleoside diphosphate kinase
MLLLTTSELPEGLVVKDAYSLVWVTHVIQISQKTVVQSIGGFFSGTKNRDEFNEALRGLSAKAPSQANAIIGIQSSSTSQQFSNGAYLYLTLVGTPITYEARSV